MPDYTYGQSRTKLSLCPKCWTYRPNPHTCTPKQVETAEREEDE